jgi:hypothetical protein
MGKLSKAAKDVEPLQKAASDVGNSSRNSGSAKTVDGAAASVAQRGKGSATQRNGGDAVATDADGGNAAAMRRANITELPTMAKITGLKPVPRGVTISMVALRSGPAAHCAMNEKTTMAAAAVKCMELHGVIDTAIDMRHAGGALVDISPGGIVDIQVRRSAAFKVGHCGIIDMRILEEEAADFMDMAPDVGVLAFRKVVDDTPEDAYEAIVEDEFFPAGVIEQIWLQRGVVANVKRDLGQVGSKALVYQVVVPEGEILDQIIADGYLVLTSAVLRPLRRVLRALLPPGSPWAPWTPAV